MGHRIKLILVNGFLIGAKLWCWETTPSFNIAIRTEIVNVYLYLFISGYRSRATGTRWQTWCTTGSRVSARLRLDPGAYLGVGAKWALFPPPPELNERRRVKGRKRMGNEGKENNPDWKPVMIKNVVQICQIIRFLYRENLNDREWQSAYTDSHLVETSALYIIVHI